ncbi:putative solute-binding protein [Litoribacillus peritrichatus]
MNKLMIAIRSLVIMACLTVPIASSADPVTRLFCVFDPVGHKGPLFTLMKEAQVIALDWGIQLDMTAYTDEGVAEYDFRAKQCDAVLLTGTRARNFNKFTGSLEAMGAIPSTQAMRLVLHTLMQPRAYPLLVENGVEVAGIYPAGAIYLLTRDKSINHVTKLQGQRVATLENDKASMAMVRHVGGTIVSATSATFAGLFNNGSADIAYAPLVAFEPLEMAKGVDPNGGIFNYAIAQMNFQMLIHPERFPPGFGQKARELAIPKFDDAFEIVAKAESRISDKYWIQPEDGNRISYDNMLKEVRLSLRDEGVYHPKALKLFKRIRCKQQPNDADCSDPRE